jgi:hypothetical protein
MRLLHAYELEAHYRIWNSEFGIRDAFQIPNS